MAGGVSGADAPAGLSPGRRRVIQLAVWTLVIGVFCLLGTLAGVSGPGAEGEKAVRPATQTVSAASGPGQVLAAPAPEPGGGGGSDSCSDAEEARDFLPMHRWDSVDLEFLTKWGRIHFMLISVIAMFMFWVASLIWSVLGILMGFGYTFDMICLAADPINAAAGQIAIYAAWFLIPAWLVVFAAALRSWNSGKGAARTGRAVLGFMVATGMIFFLADQSKQNVEDPLGEYTAPWMAAEVQGALANAYTSIVDLGKLDSIGNSNGTAFYDSETKHAGHATCVGLDNALYDQYATENADTGIKNGIGAMQQVSRIWELAYLRSWQAAQFGTGSLEYPSASHGSCRFLEGTADIDKEKRWLAYDLSIGKPPGTTTGDTSRGMFLSRADGNHPSVVIAYTACLVKADGEPDGVIPQWKDIKPYDGIGRSPNKADGCKAVYGGQGPDDEDKDEHCDWGDTGCITDAFYFNGNDEINDATEDCGSDDKACDAVENMIRSWYGENAAQRFIQGMMALVTAFAFAFTLGPMAIGLVITSVALAGLVMIMGFTLIMLAMGREQGKKLAKLTGAAAAAQFIFGLALTALMMMIVVTYGAVEAAVGNDQGFVAQVLLAAAPLAALYLFKKLTKALGFGDISSMTGALGFAGTAALKATGDQDLSQNAAQRVSGAIGGIGIGNKRLGNLDERSMQSRMFNNRLTRAPFKAAGAAIGRRAKPAMERMRRRGQNAKVGALEKGWAAQTWIGTKTRAAARAARYRMITKPSEWLANTRAGQWAADRLPSRASIPLLRAAAHASLLNKAGALEGKDGSLLGAMGALSGYSGYGKLDHAKFGKSELAKDEIFNNKLKKVRNPEERRRLEAGHTEKAFDAHVELVTGTKNFRGIASAAERIEITKDVAARLNVKPEHLTVTEQGLAVVKPAAVDPRTGKRIFAPDATMEYISNPVHYLDRHTLQHKMVNGRKENDDERAVRLFAELRARGYVTDRGETVDFFEAHGFDTRLPEVRERVMAFASGHRDEELSQLIIKARRPEHVAVQTGRDWARRHQVENVVAERQAVRSYAQIYNDAEAETIRGLNKVELGLPDGTSTTVGEVNRNIKNVKMDLGQLRIRMDDTVARRNTARMRGDVGEVVASERMLADLRNQIQGQVQAAVQQLSLVDEGLEVSNNARLALEVQALLANPANRGRSDQELEAVVTRLSEELDASERKRRDELEKLVGALSLMPDNAKKSADFANALDELTTKLQDWMGATRNENSRTLAKIDQVREVLETRERLNEADPRRAAESVRRASELIAANSAIGSGD